MSKSVYVILDPIYANSLPKLDTKLLIGRSIININHFKTIPAPKDENEYKEMIKHQQRLQSLKEKKIERDVIVKSNVLYLGMLLLILDEKSQITFELNPWRIIQDHLRNKSFICSSIISNEKQVFTERTYYKPVYNTKLKMTTIAINDETGLPEIGQSDVRNYSLEQRLRVQQHILLETINRILTNHDCSIHYVTSKHNTSEAPAINLTNFIDIDETNGQFLLYQKNKDFESNHFGNIVYRDLCSALCTFFDYFFYDKPIKTKKLIQMDYNNHMNVLI